MRRIAIAIFVIFYSVIVYSQEKKVYYDEKIIVDENNVPLDSNQYYFPLKLIPITEPEYKSVDSTIIEISFKELENTTDTFLVSWFSKQLFALREPLLFNKKQKKEVIRFTWLRTFHQPISIRIEKESNEIIAYLKIGSGYGGYKPEMLWQNEKIILSQENWLELTRRIENADFWNLKSGAIFGTDGSEWILECVDDEKYHIVHYWTPKNGKFYDICDYIINLSKLEIPLEERY